MTNLSDLLPAGAASKQLSFTASGAISSGQTVGLKTDGTVEAVGTVAEAVGTEANYQTNGLSEYGQVVFDPDTGKTLIAYTDIGDSSKGKVVVATPTASNTISYGTPVEFSTTASYIAMTYDTGQNKVLLAYRGASNHVRARVGTVSGTSISFGTELVVENETSAHIALAYDPDLGSHLVVYDYNSDRGKARVLTVSGTDVSKGSDVQFDSSQVSQCAVAYDESADAYLVAYRDQGNSNYATAFVTTVSGTTPSFGTAVVFESANSIEMDATYDSSAQKVVITYRDLGVNQPTAIVGTISGTSVSFGTANNIVNVNSTVGEAAYDSTNNKIVLVYRDEDAENGTYVVGTVSGTSISFATPVAFNSGPTTDNAIGFDSTLGKFVIAYSDYRGSGSNTPYGTAVTLQLASTNSSSFLGIADAAISDAASGKITMKGGIAANGLSGLTPGATYYVQDDGTLNTATSAVNYDIANGSYTQAFSVSSQDTFPSGVAFNPAGTKMFVVGNTGDDVNEYTLSTGFDVSTASFVDSFSVSGQQAAPMSVAFNTDGTKMYIVGETEDTVAEYALSAGFDVSSASYTQAFDISGQETEAQGITFNTDGTKMFIVGDTGNDINEYTLSSGFDVSTASFVDSFSLASQTTQPKEGVFNTDGTELYVLARDNQKVYKYTLTAAFDVSTASYASVEFSVSSQETSPQGLAFSADGSKMYVCGDTGDDVNQYATTSTATNSTTVEAGKAMSATSINLDYST